MWHATTGIGRRAVWGSSLPRERTSLIPRRDSIPGFLTCMAMMLWPGGKWWSIRFTKPEGKSFLSLRMSLDGVYVDPPSRLYPPRSVGSSGLKKPGESAGEPMSQADIDAVIEAYGVAAANAVQVGFDGIEIHAAHGYLIDQHFWEGTNQRTDPYGGDLVSRTRFGVEVASEVRRRVGSEFPLALRFSQWKLQNYDAKLARTPAELGSFLDPLCDAGVDLFHCSTRRFWEPEFAGSNTQRLAGWTKTLTGKPTITVGSVTLNDEFTKSFATRRGCGDCWNRRRW